MTRNGAEAGLNLFTYLVRSWQYYRLVHHEPSSALLIFLLVKEMQAADELGLDATLVGLRVTPQSIISGYAPH